MNAPNILERHFTCQELADQWHLGYNTILAWFRDEAGVLKTGNASLLRRRRTKVSIRIPESVAIRVYAERTK